LGTQSTAQPLTTGDRDLVNYFFLRLETSYGRKFWTEFSDEKTVALTKREWANRISTYSKQDLNEAIELAKDERERGNEEFEWPDIAKILGLLKNRISPTGTNAGAYLEYGTEEHPAYERPAIEDFGKKARTEKARDKTLNKLKDLLG